MSAAKFHARLDRLDKANVPRTRAEPALTTEAAAAPSEEDRQRREDRDRYFDLLARQRMGRGLSDTDQIELELLERRFPPDPDNPLDRAIMEFRAEHGQL